MKDQKVKEGERNGTIGNHIYLLNNNDGEKE